MTSIKPIPQHSSAPELILGSTSRYRKEMLERLHIPFRIQKPDADETPLPHEPPAQLAVRLALQKANAVALLNPKAVVIGSDQVADLNGTPIGKPGNYARAFEQLQLMSGKTVIFQTAVAVVCLQNQFEQSELVQVKVQFRTLNADEIDRYLKIEEPYDCAGSAKSEGLGISLLEAIHNDDPTALVGLPLIATARLLRAAGLTLP